MEFVIPSRFTAIDDYSAKVTAMQRATTRFAEAAEISSARVERRYRNLAQGAQQVAMKSAIVGAAILGPLGYAVNSAIQYEDKLADIQKTTGLSGDALKSYGLEIRNVSKTTRTSLDDLLKIGEIGGQLGIAQEQLLDFTKSANVFAVALGKDFTGGVEEAVTAVTKITTLFGSTKNMPVAEAISRVGSAINDLGAVGTAKSQEITDFALRLGALPAALQPSIQTTAALGTVFAESNIAAERAASGFSKILLDAGNNLGAYAKQLHISRAAAADLLKSDPTKLVTDLAFSLKDLKGGELSKALQNLKIGNVEQISVLGALGQKTARFSELQHVANKAFFENNSLTSEYAVKNNTAAGKIEQLQNNMLNLSIVLGEKLVPNLLKITDRIVLLMDKFDAWAQQNPNTLSGLLKVAAVIGILAVGVSAISTVFSGIFSVISFGASVVPMLIAAWAAVSTFFAMNVVPIFEVLWAVIIGGVEAAAAALGVGAGAFAAIAAVVIGIFIKIYQNWERIVAAFQDGGIVHGITVIGTTLLDVILHPLQLIFELIARLPGSLGEAGAYFASGIQDLRATLDVAGTEAVNPKKAEQDAMISKQETISKQNVAIDINDRTGGRASVNSTGGGVPVKVSSTQTFQLNNQ